MDNQDDLLQAYPVEQREFLRTAIKLNLLTWSDDAAQANKGRGYYIAANKLVSFLNYFLGGE